MISGPFPVRNVSVTIDGVTHDGTYYVQQSMVYVQSAFGTKATQVGGWPPESIAKLPLSELVRASEALERPVVPIWGNPLARTLLRQLARALIIGSTVSFAAAGHCNPFQHVAVTVARRPNP